jgi:hypothetical protein
MRFVDEYKAEFLILRGYGVDSSTTSFLLLTFGSFGDNLWDV